MTPEEAEALYGPHYNTVPSFGLRQGLNSKGEPKFRRIDDHTAGWVNLAAKRMQKIKMANADYIAVMVKHSGEAHPDEDILLATAGSLSPTAISRMRSPVSSTLTRPR